MYLKRDDRPNCEKSGKRKNLTDRESEEGRVALDLNQTRVPDERKVQFTMPRSLKIRDRRQMKVM